MSEKRTVDEISKYWSDCQRGIRPSLKFSDAVDDMHTLVAEVERLRAENTRLNNDKESLRMLTEQKGAQMMHEIENIVRKYR